MINLRVCVATVALCTMAAVPAARANTVTFTDIPEVSYGVWVEDGITVEPGGGLGLGYHHRPGTMHLVDGGAGFASSATFTMGSRFDAMGFDIIPGGSAYCTEQWDDTTCGASYDNVQVSGFRDGIEVVDGKFFMGADPFTFDLGHLFRNIDSLVIAALIPDVDMIGGYCFNSPCAHFNIDNVTLSPVALSSVAVSPVPVPAAFPLFLSTLAGLGWVGWRRRRLVPAEQDQGGM